MKQKQKAEWVDNGTYVNWVELDLIRQEVRTLVKLAQKRHKFKGGAWEISIFYIGITTTSVNIRHINLPYLAITKLAKDLRRIFPLYRVTRRDHSLRIYLRANWMKD